MDVEKLWPGKKQKPTLVKWKQKQYYKLTNPLTRRFIIPEMIDQDDYRIPSYSPIVRENVSDETIKNPFTNTCGGMCFRDLETGELGNEIYFVGIIDILQQYNRHKKLEHFVKSLLDDPEIISSVHPDLYSRRFNRFLSKKIV